MAACRAYFAAAHCPLPSAPLLSRRALCRALSLSLCNGGQSAPLHGQRRRPCTNYRPTWPWARPRPSQDRLLQAPSEIFHRGVSNSGAPGAGGGFCADISSFVSQLQTVEVLRHQKESMQLKVQVIVG